MYHGWRSIQEKVSAFLEKKYDLTYAYMTILSLMPLIGLFIFPFHSLDDDLNKFLVVSVVFLIPTFSIISFLVPKLRLANLPLYLLETFGVIWFSYQYFVADSALEEALRLMFLLGFVGFGFYLLKPDIIEVILNSERVRFRKNKRVQLRMSVECSILSEETFSPQFHMAINNIGQKGICFTIKKSDLDKNLVWLHKDDFIRISVLAGEKSTLLSGQIKWIKKEGTSLTFGVQAESKECLEDIFKFALKTQKRNPYKEKMIKIADSPITLKAVAIFWAIGTLFSVGAPSCQRAEVVGIQENALTSEDKISVDISFSSGTGLSLTQTESQASLFVEGCVSGLNQIISPGSAAVKLYAGDRKCEVRLIRFFIDSEMFSIDPSSQWSGTTGSLNSFIGNEGSSAQVLVVEQLPKSLGENPQVRFSINQMKAGEGRTLDLNANIVTIQSITPVVMEGEDQFARFRIEKVAQANTDPLTIYYEVVQNGLSSGSDYVEPSGSITIPEGLFEIELSIEILDDRIAEQKELLSIELMDNENYYHFGSASSLIEDNDYEIVKDIAIHLSQESIILDGNRVSNWEDLTSNANHAVQSFQERMPIWDSTAMAENGALVFDGIDDSFRIYNSDSMNTQKSYDHKALFLVFQTGTDISSRQVLYEQGGHYRGINIYIDDGLLFLNAWNLANDDGNPWSQTFVTSAVEASTDYLATLKFDAKEATLSGYINGSVFDVVSGVARLYAHPDNIGLGSVSSQTLFHDGASEESNYPFSGKIAEFLAYNRDLSEDDIQSINGNLAEKYSLRIPKVSIEFLSDSDDEGSSSSNYIRLSRSYASSSDLEVVIDVSGSAEAGVDYSALSDTYVIPAFSTQIDFPFYIMDDDLEEDTEHIFAELRSSQGMYLIENGSASFSIIDNDSFSPPEETILWLRADLGVIEQSSLVNAWQDQGSYSHSITQSSSTLKPKLLLSGINNLSAIDFTSDFKTLDLANSAQLNLGNSVAEKQFYVALRTGDDVDTYQVIYEQGGRNRGINLYIENGEIYGNAYSFKKRRSSGTWGPVFVRAPISPSQTYIVSLTFDQPSDEFSLRLNGQPVHTAAGIDLLGSHSGTIGIGAVNKVTRHHTGMRYPTGHSYKGMIAEMVFYNRVLSTDERLELEAYLVNKYAP